MTPKNRHFGCEFLRFPLGASLLAKPAKREARVGIVQVQTLATVEILYITSRQYNQFL